jgi:hypothetical protein
MANKRNRNRKRALARKVAAQTAARLKKEVRLVIADARLCYASLGELLLDSRRVYAATTEFPDAAQKG